MKYRYKSQKSLVVVVSVYLIVFAIMSLTRFFSFIQLKMFDRDGYLNHINRFEDQSFYDEIAYGTSVVFNAFIYFINYFHNNLDSSFRILNVISVVLLGLLGGIIIFKNRDEHKWLTFLFIPLFMLFWLNDEQVQWTNNDIFLSVIVLLIYLLLFTSYRLGNKAVNLGILFALLFSTRLEFSLVLIPSFIFCFVTLLMNKKIKKKHLSLFSITFILCLFVIHYPSIIESSNLSGFVKNEGLNYNHINSLGTMIMFDTDTWSFVGNYNNYWDVEKIEYYKDYYQITKLPDNFLEFIIRYPGYYIKLFLLNQSSILIHFFRRYGFMIFFPLIMLIQDFKIKKWQILIDKENLPFTMFLISSFTLSLVLNTIVEFRWFDTFEFLLLLSIFISIKKMINKNIRFQSILIITLILVTIFNLRTIVNIF
jgi:hypothetical protein